jgi:DNA-binding response OmpR family regulator
MDDFLTKPIRVEELYAAIDRMTHRSTVPERELGKSLQVCDRADEREPVLTSVFIQEGSEP